MVMASSNIFVYVLENFSKPCWFCFSKKITVFITHTQFLLVVGAQVQTLGIDEHG